VQNLINTKWNVATQILNFSLFDRYRFIAAVAFQWPKGRSWPATA
jgi:hypothetical protein